MGEGKSETRPEHSAADAFTRRPTPLTCWCDMEVSESCAREMCTWDGARPGLRGRREGRETGRVREPDRKENSGRGVRDDLLLVAWQPFLFTWQTYKILFHSIYSFHSISYALFGNWGLALSFVSEFKINSLNGLKL